MNSSKSQMAYPTARTLTAASSHPDQFAPAPRRRPRAGYSTKESTSARTRNTRREIWVVTVPHAQYRNNTDIPTASTETPRPSVP
jgi:hypothetical protein